MPDLDLQAIKARAEAVTQRHGPDSDHEQVRDMSGDPNGCCVCNARNYRPDYALVSLFAQANADILALVAEVERLQAALKQATDTNTRTWDSAISAAQRHHDMHRAIDCHETFQHLRMLSDREWVPAAERDALKGSGDAE